MTPAIARGESGGVDLAHSAMAVRPMLYADYRSIARNGDIGLEHPTSIEGRLIQRVRPGLHGPHPWQRYSHAFLIGWLDHNEPGDALLMTQAMQGKGVHTCNFSTEVKRWPGCADIYRVRQDRYQYHNAQAWRWAVRATNQPYSWKGIIRIWLRTRLWESLRPGPLPNVDEPEWPRFCSWLVAAATRIHGGPQFAEYDCDVAPNDLVWANCLEYLGTLFETQEQVEAFQADRSILASGHVAEFDRLRLNRRRTIPAFFQGA
jgi:hypothetical protein